MYQITTEEYATNNNKENLMEIVRKLEDKLAELYKSAPKLSESSKETLVKVWPWLALIFGVLQLLSAITLFNWARAASSVANDLYRAIGAESAAVSRFSVWLWISLLFLALEGVLLLMAYSKLAKREKSGWDLLFLVGLLNVGYAVLNLFIDRGGMFGLIWNLAISAVVFWLLFAVRDKYHGSVAAPKSANTLDNNQDKV